jgi:hypothetical protein
VATKAVKAHREGTMHLVWALLSGSFLPPLVYWFSRVLRDADAKRSADEDDYRYWQRIESKRPSGPR